jgi:uncharacterized protein YjhX (UPF0386 family)
LKSSDATVELNKNQIINQGGRMPMKRTTHRSVKGTKLYAVRDAKGRFVDIQSYKRAHAADMRRKSKAEGAKKGQ